MFGTLLEIEVPVLLREIGESSSVAPVLDILVFAVSVHVELDPDDCGALFGHAFRACGG
jgi:hypothetical protein